MNPATSKLIVSLGELLWDMLPSGPQLGGAAANFAAMAAQLGDHAACASRVGNDDPGRQARSRLADLSVDTSFLQTDPRHPTGSVLVTLSESYESRGSQPKYSIPRGAAWDFLELTGSWLDLARRADAVCFGTLAQRAPVSRRAIQGFLAATRPQCVRVLDVNLRAPFYSARVLERSLARATLLKMNDEEAPRVLDLLGSVQPGGVAQEERLLAGARQLLDRFPLELVCVTRGESGSLLVTRNEHHRHPGIAVSVADTVGAGDAFAAAMTHLYLRKAPLAAMSEAANRWGSWVASQPGGTPRLDSVSE